MNKLITLILLSYILIGCGDVEYITMTVSELNSMKSKYSDLLKENKNTIDELNKFKHKVKKLKTKNKELTCLLGEYKTLFDEPAC